MTSPTPSIPQSLTDFYTTTSENLGENKLTIGYAGFEKCGKTTYAFSFPGRIESAYADPNREKVNAIIEERGKGDIRLWDLSKDDDPAALWTNYREKFVPAVANREFDAETIVVEGYNRMAQSLVFKVGGVDGPTIKGWGQVLVSHTNAMAQLLSAATPRPGKPSYNIVVTCHLTDVSDKTGAVTKYRPAIAGAFKDDFGRNFGALLVCHCQVENTVVGGKLTPGKPNYVCYSVPPNPLYACGDSIGGKGKYKALPPVIEDASYEGLCKLWGRDR